MSWRRHGTSTPVPKVKAKVKGFTTKGKQLKGSTTKGKFKTLPKIFPLDAVLRYTNKAANAAYLDKRCKSCNKTKVKDAIGMKYKDGNGVEKTYGYADLKYEVVRGRLEVKS